MNVTCPSCSAAIAGGDVNVQRMVAKCRRCESIFDFSDQFEKNADAPLAQRRRARVPLPAGITMIEGDGPPEAGFRDAPAKPTFTLVRRWFSPKLFFLAFFCVFWDGFLINLYSNLRGGATLAALFPLLHVAVGLGLTYSTLCGFVNRTHIIVTGDSLRVSHGPLPWWGNRTIPADELAQLYCEERIKSGRNGQSATYYLNALLKDGRKVKLLTGLLEPPSMSGPVIPGFERPIAVS